MSLQPVDRAEPSAEVLHALGEFATATLHEAAGQIGALPSEIKPVDPGFRLCGRAITVSTPAGDNLWIHRALAAAGPGDVLVVETGGGYEAGYWGDVMSSAALARRLAGVVIDGRVRDQTGLASIGVPVFARGLCIRGTTKNASGVGSVGGRIAVGNVVIAPGDVVVGDADGVVVIPGAAAAAALEKARARTVAEDEIRGQLAQGATTLDIYGLEHD